MNNFNQGHICTRWFTGLGLVYPFYSVDILNWFTHISDVLVVDTSPDWLMCVFDVWEYLHSWFDKVSVASFSVGTTDFFIQYHQMVSLTENCFCLFVCFCTFFVFFLYFGFVCVYVCVFFVFVSSFFVLFCFVVLLFIYLFS